MAKKKYQGMQSLGVILKDSPLDRKKYITREFQDYGYRLACELGDLEHKSLYIRLAKEERRELLEEAKIFVKEAYDVKNRARLFMWKLKELRSQTKQKRSKKVHG